MTRKSKRELQQTVESLKDGPDDCPVISLATLLSADDVEKVPGRPNLLCVDGQLYKKSGFDLAGLTEP